MQILKFKVVYFENGTRVTEFCKTMAFAKKRAKKTGGTFGRAE